MVYNFETGKLEALKFLRLNQINKYNNGMGDVDVAGQLRGVYRLYRWARNRKWWCSVMFWSMGVLLTKFLQIVSEDVQGGRRKTSVQRSVSVSKGNFRILD